MVVRRPERSNVRLRREVGKDRRLEGTPGTVRVQDLAITGCDGGTAFAKSCVHGVVYANLPAETRVGGSAFKQGLQAPYVGDGPVQPPPNPPQRMVCATPRIPSITRRVSSTGR